MAATPRESAKFIFEGKVIKTTGGNVKAAAGADRTILASVERVVKAPPALAGYSGHEVTVRLAQGEKVKKGQRARFFTNGWIFGENLAVESVGHEPIASASAAAAAAAAAPEPDPARVAAHDRIRERAEEAPVVITGKVVAVGVPASPSTAAAAVAPSPERISEHEPFWREAVVEVKQVHKGTLGQDRVVLRFPSSTDVRWHRAPKFQAGQEGVFSLHPDAVSAQIGLGAAAASLGAAPETFTCLSSADFQPAHDQAEAAVAIEAAKK